MHGAGERKGVSKVPPAGKRSVARKASARKKPRGVEPVVRRIRNLWKMVGQLEPSRRDALYDQIADSVERLDAQLKKRMADLAARPINHHPLFQPKELLADIEPMPHEGS